METAILICTYNEIDNISELLKSILSLNSSWRILVVDDNSPDLTWAVVEEVAKKHPQVSLIRRFGRRGRGLAGADGYRYIVLNEPDIKYIVEMDADFSHDPQSISLFLQEIKDTDLVIGSRHLGDRSVDQRGTLRRFISKIATHAIKSILGVNLTDPSSGYRCLRREIIEKIGTESLYSKDPFILTELLYKTYKKGFCIKEIPITFSNRKYGKSKLPIRTLLTYPLRLFLLKFKKYS